MTDWIVGLHTFSTVAMAGLIWFVQVVHYPLMARVGSEAFATYEAEHVRRTTWVVAPLMLVELATALWLVLVLAAPGHGWVPAVGVLLLAVIWGSTVVIQVPIHRRLQEGFERAALTRLERTNWVRTLGWTLRAILAVYLSVLHR